MTAPAVVAFDLSLTATGVAAGWGETVIASKLRGMPRLAEIRREVMGRCDGGPGMAADLVVLEGYAFGRPNQAAHLGELGGVIRLALHDAGIPYVDVPPSNVKKYATGKGNAPKPDVRMEVFKRHGRDIANDNECDAFVLRAMALDHYGAPLVAMPATHRAALTAVDWPDL